MSATARFSVLVLLLLALGAEAQRWRGRGRQGRGQRRRYGQCNSRCGRRIPCGYGLQCRNRTCTCTLGRTCSGGKCRFGGAQAQPNKNEQKRCNRRCGGYSRRTCAKGMRCIYGRCRCDNSAQCRRGKCKDSTNRPGCNQPCRRRRNPCQSGMYCFRRKCVCSRGQSCENNKCLSGNQPPSTTPVSNTKPDSTTTKTTMTTTMMTTTMMMTTTTTPTTTTAATTRAGFSTLGGKCFGLQSMRKSVHSMSNGEWKAYVDAVRKLRETPGDNGVSVFENFVQAHVTHNGQSHFGAYFLPWHRQMLAAYEAALNAVSPTRISIPYWEWTNVNTNHRSDRTFWDRYGSSARNAPIPKAPFKDWNSRIEASHSVLRGFDANTQTPEDDYFVSRENINEWIQDGTREFATFSEYVEAVHGIPHVAIAGDMDSLFVSPNDPMFYSHHAFIDKIWWDWQRTAGNGGKFGGVHSNQPASLGARMQPWGRTVKQIIEEISPCIRYAGGTSRMAVASLERATVIQQSTSTPKAAKIKTKAENRKIQKKIAEKKVSGPDEYKRKLKEAAAILKALKRSLRRMRAPADFAARAEKSFKVVEKKIGVDVEEAPKLEQASNSIVVEDGKKEIAAIDSGKAPPGKSDDDVEEK